MTNPILTLRNGRKILISTLEMRMKRNVADNGQITIYGELAAKSVDSNNNLRDYIVDSSDMNIGHKTVEDAELAVLRWLQMGIRDLQTMHMNQEQK